MDPFWTENICSLFTSLNIFPTASMTKNQKLNAMTRLVLLLSIVFLLIKPQISVAIFVGGLILILILKNVNSPCLEGFCVGNNVVKSIDPRKYISERPMDRFVQKHVQTPSTKPIIAGMQSCDSLYGTLGDSGHGSAQWHAPPTSVLDMKSGSIISPGKAYSAMEHHILNDSKYIPVANGQHVLGGSGKSACGCVGSCSEFGRSGDCYKNRKGVCDKCQGDYNDNKGYTNNVYGTAFTVASDPVPGLNVDASQFVKDAYQCHGCNATSTESGYGTSAVHDQYQSESMHPVKVHYQNNSSPEISQILNSSASALKKLTCSCHGNGCEKCSDLRMIQQVPVQTPYNYQHLKPLEYFSSGCADYSVHHPKPDYNPPGIKSVEVKIPKQYHPSVPDFITQGPDNALLGVPQTTGDANMGGNQAFYEGNFSYTRSLNAMQDSLIKGYREQMVYYQNPVQPPLQL